MQREDIFIPCRSPTHTVWSISIISLLQWWVMKMLIKTGWHSVSTVCVALLLNSVAAGLPEMMEVNKKVAQLYMRWPFDNKPPMCLCFTQRCNNIAYRVLKSSFGGITLLWNGIVGQLWIDWKIPWGVINAPQKVTCFCSFVIDVAYIITQAHPHISDFDITYRCMW